MRKRAWRLGALVLVSLMALSGVALASNNTPPVLKTPGRNAVVHPGRITFKVYDPGLSGLSTPVFVAVDARKQVAKDGLLNNNCSVSKGCDFFSMKRWHGHPGWWTYTSPANTSFPGWYATTPGKYYWQARHTAPACDAPGCELHSSVHAFRVS